MLKRSGIPQSADQHHKLRELARYYIEQPKKWAEIRMAVHFLLETNPNHPEYYTYDSTSEDTPDTRRLDQAKSIILKRIAHHIEDYDERLKAEIFSSPNPIAQRSLHRRAFLLGGAAAGITSLLAARKSAAATTEKWNHQNAAAALEDQAADHNAPLPQRVQALQKANEHWEATDAHNVGFRNSFGVSITSAVIATALRESISDLGKENMKSVKLYDSLKSLSEQLEEALKTKEYRHSTHHRD